MQKRVIGVRVVGVVAVLYGIFLLCLSAAAFLAPFWLADEEKAEYVNRPGTDEAVTDDTVFYGMGLALLTVAAAAATTGIGLLRGKNWARILCVCLCVFLFLGSLAGLRRIGPQFFISIGHLLMTTVATVFLLLPGTACLFRKRLGNT